MFGFALLFGFVEYSLVMETIGAYEGSGVTFFGDDPPYGPQVLLKFGCLVGGALFAMGLLGFVFALARLFGLFPSEQDEHTDARRP